METIKRLVASKGWWQRGMNWQNTEDFQGHENIPQNNTMVDTGQYTLLKTHPMPNAKNEFCCKL